MPTKAVWTVKQTKRKASNAPESVPKTARPSTSVAGNTALNSRKRKQTTLTQIPWNLSRSASFVEDDLTYIDPYEGRAHSEGARTVSGNKDSTLTQTDFTERASLQAEVGGGMDLPEQQEPGPTIPQFDGRHESPRKKRPCKVTSSAASAETTALGLLEGGMDMQVPPSRKRKASDATPTAQGDPVKRRSRRKASKVLSDPEQNYKYCEESRTPSPRASAPSPTVVGVQAPPPLEIQDSTDACEDQENIAPWSRPTLIGPATPKKREVIPSSQSPESLPATIKKSRKVDVDLTRPEKSPRRPPLLVCSGNARGPRKNTCLTSTVDESPKRSGTSGLKLPRKDQDVVQRRVEDSQTSLWSVLATSSPTSKKRSPDLALSAALNVDETNLILPEIPATSQIDDAARVMSSPLMLEMPDDFASMARLHKTADQSQPFDATDQVVRVESATIVKDFAYEGVQNNSFAPLVEDNKALEQITVVQEEVVEDDVFGSPVKNDTQFNVELNRRITTSPILATDPLDPSKSTCPGHRIRLSNSSSSGQVEAAAGTTIPTPRLVRQLSYVHTETTRVPLNDHSSPTLPPQRTPTQCSIHPASLPHPSQISTQEPSQQLPLMSSPPLQQVSSHELDRITIKDSNSSHVELEDIPQYGVELDENDGNDDDAYEYDGDLDPITQPIRRSIPASREVPDSDDEFDDITLMAIPQQATDDTPAQPEPKPQPGADAESQRNFTQGGHVTASRLQRMREQGLIPDNYEPDSFQVPTDPRQLGLPTWVFDDPFADDSQ